jgi:hypothetical protein
MKQYKGRRLENQWGFRIMTLGKCLFVTVGAIVASMPILNSARATEDSGCATLLHVIDVVSSNSRRLRDLSLPGAYSCDSDEFYTCSWYFDNDEEMISAIRSLYSGIESCIDPSQIKRAGTRSPKELDMYLAPNRVPDYQYYFRNSWYLKNDVEVELILQLNSRDPRRFRLSVISLR